MKPKGYLLITFLVNIATFSNALEEGEPCVSSLGWNGICLLSYECSNLGSEIENGYAPELCNTTGPVICCPREKSIPVTEISEDHNYQIVAAEQQQRPLFTPIKMEMANEKKRKVPQMYMRSRRRRPLKKRHPHILVKTYDDVNSIRIRTHRVKPVRRKRKPSRKSNPFSSNSPIDFKVLAKQQLAKNAALLNSQYAETSLHQEIAEAHRSGDEEAVLLLTDMSQATSNPSRSSETHRLSQIMCETYGELVSETVAELSKSGIVPVKSERCSASATSRSSFAMLGEYPHVAGLGYSDASKRILWGQCSGALISDQFVVTAAHCTHSPIGKPKSVVLGTVNLGNENIIGISEVIRHPAYNRTTYANNLALLRLAKIPKLTDSLRPACLPSSSIPKNLVATYWSKNEAILEIKMEGNKTKKFSDVNNLSLQKMKMAFAENSDCEISNELGDSFLCAKVNSVRRSSQSCQGKGGDPIQVKNPENKCMYNLVGIAVENICDESVPIAFTKLDKFLPWIESIVWE